MEPVNIKEGVRVEPDTSGRGGGVNKLHLGRMGMDSITSGGGW